MASSKTTTDASTTPSNAPPPAATTEVVVQGKPVVTAPAAQTLGPDGKPLEPLKPGDPEPSMPNAASTGKGTTQEDADKAAGGNYRVLYPISYGAKDGSYQQAKPGDIVFLAADDAKGLLASKAVESADTSGAETKPGETDPRKIQ